MNLEQIVQAIMAILIPTFPYLVKGIKVAGEKAAEKLGEKSGDVASDKAAKIWSAIKTKSQKLTKIENAANVLAEDPQDKDARNMLQNSLVDQLKNNPELAKELSGLIGGDSAIQQLIASSGSQAEDIDMKIKGHGKQTVKVSGKSKISNVKLSIDN